MCNFVVGDLPDEDFNNSIVLCDNAGQTTDCREMDLIIDSCHRGGSCAGEYR